MAGTPTGPLAQVTGKAVSIDPAKHYDTWAESYESDLLGNYGYCAPDIAVQALGGFVTDRSVEILDVGCGTGLVGQGLAKLGFTSIDGVDIAQKMLAQAERTGVYRTLIHQDAGSSKIIPAGRYDAVVSVGSFGAGHLGPDALTSLITMARPGGAIAIFMNAEPFEDDDYAGEISRLEEKRLWTVSRVEDHNYMSKLDRPGKLILARRCD